MKYFNLTILSLLLCFSCNAENNHINILDGTVWMLEEKRCIENIEFTKDSIRIKSTNSITKRVIEYSKPYYLITSIPNSFDNDLVGKPTCGKYLVNFNSKTNCMEYCEIKEITEDSLVLFYKKQPKNIGGADMTFTYKRVK